MKKENGLVSGEISNVNGVQDLPLEITQRLRAIMEKVLLEVDIDFKKDFEEIINKVPKLMVLKHTCKKMNSWQCIIAQAIL